MFRQNPEQPTGSIWFYVLTLRWVSKLLANSVSQQHILVELTQALIHRKPHTPDFSDCFPVQRVSLTVVAPDNWKLELQA